MSSGPIPHTDRKRSIAALTAVGLMLTGAGLALIAGPMPTVPATARPAVGGPAGPTPASGNFALTEAGASPTAISLAWARSTAGFFRNYTVVRSNAGAGGPWQVAYVTTSEAIDTAVLTELQPGTEYWWNVTAYAGLLGATPSYSDVLAAVQPTLGYLTEPARTSSSVTLAWSDNASYGGGIAFGFYRVVEIDDGVSATAANLSSVLENTTTVAGLSSGSSYSFYVETFDCLASCGGATPAYAMTESNTRVAGTATALSVTMVAGRTTTDTGLLDAFTCTPSGGTPPYAFGWNFTNGSASFLPGEATVSWAFVEPSSGGYHVTCEVTDHTASTATQALTIFVVPAPSVRASAEPASVAVGQAVSFRCVARPGIAPLSVAWVLGDGRLFNRSAGQENVSASYAAAGTYVAECVVTDALGDRAIASITVVVHALPPFAWLTPGLVLLTSTVTGGGAAAGAGAAYRRGQARERSSALSRWIPPSGPAGSVHGVKVCPKCGASNVPLRRSCSVCGSSLPRGPGP
jgi:PKD domain